MPLPIRLTARETGTLAAFAVPYGASECRAHSSVVEHSPYKRGVRRFKSYCAHKFPQLNGLFETLIGEPVTTGGNHRCMLPDGGRCPGAMAASLRPRGCAVRRRQGTTGTGAAPRPEGSAAPGLADSRLDRGEPDGWRAPRGGPGDLAGRKTGSVLDEGRLPGLVKAAACTHADESARALHIVIERLFIKFLYEVWYAQQELVLFRPHEAPYFSSIPSAATHP